MELPRLPEEVERALARLASAGIRACLVGGALRDAALGREIRDFDIVVASPLEVVRTALPEAVPIRARTPVLAIAGRGRTFRIEITALRAGASTLEQDLALRDFTLNSFAFDPQRRVFIDPLGGRADLEARVLRASDPARGFGDDPARVLRAVRLCQELELALEPRTRRAMEAASFRVQCTPGERLRGELFRLLELPRAAPGIDELRRVGALACVLPELLREVGIAQNRYHRDDVYAHTLRVCDGVRPDPTLRLAALLHDAAKPETKRRSARTKDACFYRHDVLGPVHVARTAERLRLSRRERDRVERLVRHHLLFPDRLKSERAIRRMLARVGSDILHDLLELRRADVASRDDRTSLEEWKAIETRILEQSRRERSDRSARLAIGGRDVMREVGIADGPEVGRWLARARRRVLERPDENERGKLLAWLRRAVRAERT